QNEQARSQLAAIVDSSDDPIISSDLDGVILTWNAGAERLFGYSAEEVKGCSITLLLPNDQPLEEPEILRKVKRGERLQNYETVRVHKDGRLISVSLTISPIREGGGIIVGASGIVRDITGRKAL